MWINGSVSRWATVFKTFSLFNGWSLAQISPEKEEKLTSRLQLRAEPALVAIFPFFLLRAAFGSVNEGLGEQILEGRICGAEAKNRREKKKRVPGRSPTLASFWLKAMNELVGLLGSMLTGHDPE